MAGAKNAGVVPLNNSDTSRRLTVRFDAHGIVTAASFEQKNCSAWGGADLAMGPPKGNCLDASGGDLAEADRRALHAGFDTVTVPTDEGALKTYSGVNWFAGVDVTANFKTIMHAAERMQRGELKLTDRSLTMVVAASETGMGVHISYSDIESIEVHRHGLMPAVVIRRKDKRLDSFEIVPKILIDHQQTEAVGELLQTKIEAERASTSQ
jgi:hypothetical protein